MTNFDVHLHLSDTIEDPAAHHESNVVDIRRDRKTLDSNGGQGFVREASRLERQAYDLGDSPTAITEVSLVEVDGQVGLHRLTWDPAKGRRPTPQILAIDLYTFYDRTPQL